MGKDTDRIFKGVIDRSIPEESIPFIDKSTTLKEIRTDMEAKFPSLNKFANYCSINASQLCEFYKGTKNMGRDNLLAIFISLDYSLDKIQTMLRHLESHSLDVKKRRDYQIIVGIRDEKSLYEIDNILFSKGFEPLLNDSKNKGAKHNDFR